MQYSGNKNEKGKERSVYFLVEMGHGHHQAAILQLHQVILCPPIRKIDSNKSILNNQITV